MLAEILTWLATPTTPEARRLGYLKAAIDLQVRAERCHQAWSSHQEHCRQAIRDSVARCPKRRTALVLGSGIGLEFSLAELSAGFDRVVLADMVHLPALRRQARKLPNVELLPLDLTGLAKPLLTMDASATVEQIEALAVPPRLTEPLIETLDWTVSCNVLSQLPMLPVAWLERRCDLAPSDQERIGRRIMARHLDWLGTLPGTHCLIADAEQSVLDADGKLLERADIAAVFDLDRYRTTTWDWNLAPPGELADGLGAIHRVVACDWPSGYSSAATEPSGNNTSV